MKAALYAVRLGDSVEWRVSLDPSLRTDLAYWIRQDPSSRLYRWRELLPFGRALAEMERLRSESEHEGHQFGDKLVPAEEVGLGARHDGNRLDARDDGNRLGVRHDGNGLDARDYGGDAASGIQLSWSSIGSLADRLGLAMSGRSLFPEEIASLLEYIEGKPASENWRMVVQYAYLNGDVAYETGVRLRMRPRWWRFGRKVEAECRRCGSSGSSMRWTECASCGEVCAYCETCLTMGRARACKPLFIGRDKNIAELRTDQSEEEERRPVSLGNLQLSPAQAAAAEAGLRFLESSASGAGDVRLAIAARKEARTAAANHIVKPLRRFLIWAVTGAGKTEMMFPLIAAERGRGGRVLIATPRKDVVLELLPRVQAAFGGHSVTALYGGSVQRWESADITVATTHQLLRYEAAFDLVVLDEVDAYPYHNNPMLEHAAKKACKPGGAFVLLSATPPAALQRDARSGRLPHVKVPVRYHRHPLPLPVPEKPGRLALLLRRSLERGAQAFVFVPQIARLEPELRRLRQLLAGSALGGQPGRIDATSSQDPERAEKVLRFRSGEIRILLTTTILERGVTIPKADVYVLDADSRLFDAAALIQMAGRAGRSASDPDGQVYFLAKQRTRPQAEAVRQIRAMNRLAARSGYLVRQKK